MEKGGGGEGRTEGGRGKEVKRGGGRRVAVVH